METTDRYTEWLEGFKCLIYLKKKAKQTELAKTTGAGVPHINAILKGRRNAGPALQDAISHALGMTHRDVRHVGREALGLPKIVEVRQCLHLIYGPADETPASSTSAAPQSPAQIAVANGDGNQVANSVHATPVVSSPAPVVGDIARELCGLIAERLEGKDMDQQIAIRTRVKAALEGEGRDGPG